ncbi:MAG: 4-hydroxy-tetrahydrodipicolinate reductase [Clostridia bacterium]
MKVLISGALGRMGQEVAKMLDNKKIPYSKMDIAYSANSDKNCFNEFCKCDKNIDLIIDFSNHKATKNLCDYAVANNIPTVIATTGHTDEELAYIANASKNVAIFKSGNMSIGIALLANLTKLAVATMKDASVEIVEVHHDRKLDAPSGTALMLANAVKEIRPESTFVCGRSGICPRTKEEIGIHSLRMGNIIGEHEVIIATDTQTIKLKHEAHSRSLFAEGSLTVGEFIIGKPAGLYNMDNIFSL